VPRLRHDLHQVWVLNDPGETRIAGHYATDTQIRFVSQRTGSHRPDLYLSAPLPQSAQLEDESSVRSRYEVAATAAITIRIPSGMPIHPKGFEFALKLGRDRSPSWGD
jgi:hypothetical protein